ncbi:MurR/RpiR family transcriptional regulator [Gracilibacillus salinarum]|uniref:MurR/RpiR family transcriptional regulator n=1 Tax=Gracilibacillus salinarum TaxID=2932255 RepID=A0ABY4GRU1_9BACI|nr:MurR/RpiR family transcriptional regulator [Gracilibacillus salinarum]UOQ86989.1 MurR/RpiR family transcriptional regulator [Gracilibacillus salinarum]
MLINKMKYMKDLTNQEIHIVEYILHNPETVFKLTASELAKLTYTSSPTIVRLCKKLGTKGFPDFQLQFALEYKESDLTNKIKSEDDQDKNELQSKIDSLPYIYEEAVIETRKHFNISELTEIIDWLRDAHRIDIYGVDANYYIAQQVCAKWNEIGVHAMSHNSVNYHLLNNARDNQTTVSFVISHTGTNNAIIDIAKKIKPTNQKVISITGSQDNDLARIADKNIQSYYNNKIAHLVKLTNIITTQYIFDVLYLGLLNK